MTTETEITSTAPQQLFRLQRKKDSLFFRFEEKSSATHDTIGTFWADELTAILALFSKNLYGGDYTIITYDVIYKKHEDAPSSWHLNDKP